MSFQPVRLDTFLKDMTLRAKARNERQEIHLQVDAPGLRLPIDPARLAQVFDNLLINAAKYAPGADITLQLTEENNAAHIVLRDNGPGIAPEHLTNLFKRFYRVPTNDTTVRGTGLGLFICRQIVRAHGGEIRVESTLGNGTAFHINLPLEREIYESQISLRENA